MINSNISSKIKRKDALANLKKEQEKLVWGCEPAEAPKTICIVADCYSNCHISCNLNFLNDPAALGTQCAAFPKLRQFFAMWLDVLLKCQVCGYAAKEHHHYKGIHVRKARGMDSNTRTEVGLLEAVQKTVKKDLEIRSFPLCSPITFHFLLYANFPQSVSIEYLPNLIVPLPACILPITNKPCGGLDYHWTQRGSKFGIENRIEKLQPVLGE